MATPEGGAGAVYTGIAGGIKSLNIYQGPPRAAEDGAGLNVGTAVDQDTSALGGGGQLEGEEAAMATGFASVLQPREVGLAVSRRAAGKPAGQRDGDGRALAANDLHPDARVSGARVIDLAPDAWGPRARGGRYGHAVGTEAGKVQPRDAVWRGLAAQYKQLSNKMEFDQWDRRGATREDKKRVPAAAAAQWQVGQHSPPKTVLEAAVPGAAAMQQSAAAAVVLQAGQQERQGKAARQVRGLIQRCPVLFLRMALQPWARVWDTRFEVGVRKLSEQRRGVSLVAQPVMQQLGVEAVVGDVLAMEVRLGNTVTSVQVEVVPEVSPSFVIGDDLLREWVLAGWGIDESSFLTQNSEKEAEPMVVGSTIVMGELEEDGEQAWTAGELEQFWGQLVDKHQREAVGGHEPGGLVQGWKYRPQSELLREAWSALDLESAQRTGLEEEPEYTTAEQNPQEFKDRCDVFVPGGIHDKVEAWRAVRPKVDDEVLAWLEQHYEVQRHEEAVGVRCRNGKGARENPSALETLMIKRLSEGSWEMTGSVENVIPLNLVPKPGGEPPFRLVMDASPINSAYSKWKVKYEGHHTTPLAVKPGDLLFSVDLHSGYDCVLLKEGCRGLFGAKLRISAAGVARLRTGGSFQEQSVLREFPDGGVEVLVRPRTLPQGFVNSCGVFTKLTRQLCKLWRAKGYRLVHLLDDFLFAAATMEEALEVRATVLRDLESLGFFVNWQKAVLQPSHRVLFLGFIVDSLQMRFFAPRRKLEELEELITAFKVKREETTFRQMAKIAGKMISLALAISCARLFTRETYKCIRPDHDWDAVGEVSDEMVLELLEAVPWMWRFNRVGTPIRRAVGMLGLRFMMDASWSGYGFRLDRGTADVRWGKGSRGVAAEWKGLSPEAQVHRELQTLLEVLEQEPGDGSSVFANKRVLVWTDARAVAVYINTGSGPSDELSRMIKAVWRECIRLGCGVTSEHVAGTLLVAAGVDAMSRASEFVLKRNVFLQLHNNPKFGRARGFRGFTLDLCATKKTTRLARYMSRCGVGDGSLGDARTSELSDQDNFYVCPPVGIVELVLGRLEEANVCATVVVPHWVGKPWYAWLMERALEVQKLPWGKDACFVDVSEKKAKRHEFACRWEFVAALVDFRGGEWQRGKRGLLPLERVKDTQPTGEVSTRLRFGAPRGVRRSWLGNRQWVRRRKFRILSLCGGMGTVGYCTKKLRKMLGLGLEIEVVEIEWCEEARAVSKMLGGDHVTHAEPHDLWEWVADEERGKEWMQRLGEFDWFVVGFSCQDVSEANRGGLGLQGSKSSIFFVVRRMLDWATQFSPNIQYTFECTCFREKHKRDWEFVCHSLGVTPLVVDAKSVAPCRRKRAFWSSFSWLPLEWRESRPSDFLEEGRRPAKEWAWKMPTIMASGPRSWNMKLCVEEQHRDEYGRMTWRTGPMRIGEVELMMGFEEGCTAVKLNGVPVAWLERWKMLGNAIHASVMCHALVSLLVTQGHIARDCSQLQGQRWTQQEKQRTRMNKDGGGQHLQQWRG